MNTKIRRRALAAVGTLAFAWVAVGCELALDFDRSLIDGGAIQGDATFFDSPTLTVDASNGGMLEASTDAPSSETSAETGADAAIDANDAGTADLDSGDEG